ncbi:uncharacterized protein LOC127876915 isoform X1 [Dreissena polymorpha]|uniref:G-protein coupled receptors family 1 profile domain-containing protein n=1 Tax=Dreissena polymorpha TaxID=45954 RepID=A0A9D4KP62_DREPO|nr:uncharacterized protein LOC127876915 isoform X1 [Dreissena polymorpha]KAH3843457.1 hypothetical protein DPMN_116975 [Dreissena polymorpha]
MDNSTLAFRKLRNGYDLPVYGLDNGTFYYIHIPAMMCIVTSFVCAVIAIVLIFRSRGYKSFFTKWSKSERFVVYLALCDALFNVSHFTDHLHIAIAKNHVYPKRLCEFYGFNLALFITAQNLMVNIVAINAFMLLYFNKNLEFGRYDWRLLAWTFGAPFIGASIAGIAGQLGTNGAFCYFDGIKGVITNICFTTVPLLLVLVMNVIFYVLTWKRIHEQCREIRQNLGKMSTAMRASHRAARAMSMFVAAFFVQWWAMALYGVWNLVVDVVPQPVHHMVTTFSNIGGILNLIVYCIIRKKQLSKGEFLSTERKTKSNDPASSHSHFSRQNNNSMCDSQVTEQPPVTLSIIDNHLAVPTRYGNRR